MFNDVPVATPISGVVSANDAASFAVVTEAAAIVVVPIAPASKPVPAERLLTKVSIELLFELCSEATIGAPLVNVNGIVIVAMMYTSF